MGIFSTPPKRVTQKELEEGKTGLFSHEGSVYGKMKTGEDRLRPDKLSVFKSIVEGSLDSDRYKGRNYEGITPDEIEGIKKQMADSGHFNERQIAKAEKHLREKI
ncbi:hypothetical protein D4R99_00320 [bacterium]|nr:MAG: hypothetical protein D4R99_00320 [bacterium]